MGLLEGVDVSKLPKLYSTESVAVKDKVVILKFFLPGSRWTWLVTEYDPETQDCFGYVVSGLGQDCDEWGSFNLTELESIRAKHGFVVERDLHFKPKPFGELSTFDVLR